MAEQKKCIAIPKPSDIHYSQFLGISKNSYLEEISQHIIE